jgi:hypothetical protein
MRWCSLLEKIPVTKMRMYLNTPDKAFQLLSTNVALVQRLLWYNYCHILTHTSFVYLQILVGLALGLIFGLVVGSLVYHMFVSSKRPRSIVPTEKTPLLAGQHGNQAHQRDGDNNYVQIY